MRFQVGIKCIVLAVELDILVCVHGNTGERRHVHQQVSNVGVERITEIPASENVYDSLHTRVI